MMELARMGENPILVDDLNFEDENIVELDFQKVQQPVGTVENLHGSCSPESLRNSGMTIKASTVSLTGQSSRPDTAMTGNADDANFVKRGRERRRNNSAMSAEHREELR